MKEEENVEPELLIQPVSPDEEELAKHISREEVLSHEPDTGYPGEACDFCRQAFSKKRLYVDGAIQGSLMWANMCASCFLKRGQGIGWEKGSSMPVNRTTPGGW